MVWYVWRTQWLEMSSEAEERLARERPYMPDLSVGNHRRVLDKGAGSSDLNFMKIILVTKGVLIGGGKLRSGTPARRPLWRF